MPVQVLGLTSVPGAGDSFMVVAEDRVARQIAQTRQARADHPTLGAAAIGKGDPDLFETTHPYAWHGKNSNVFCIDFSAGGRWTERKAGTTVGHDFKLAALRWPERVLQFDDGHTLATTDFHSI